MHGISGHANQMPANKCKLRVRGHTSVATRPFKICKWGHFYGPLNVVTIHTGYGKSQLSIKKKWKKPSPSIVIVNKP